MKSELLIALVALVFAIISFGISFAHTIHARRGEIRPVVAIVYSEEGGWVVRNIGGGPAMNIVVAESSDAEGNREWRKPVRIPPLAVGGEFSLGWIGHSNVRAIGAAYTDFEGRDYSSICEDDLTRLVMGKVLPDFPPREVGRDWWEADAVGNRGDRRLLGGQ